MTRHGWWTLQQIVDESGVGYTTIHAWVRKRLIPTYKFPGDPLIYVPSADAGDVIAMARITIHGLDGWGHLRDVTARYGVTSPTVARWVQDGTILMIRTYGHTLYSVDSVLGHTDKEARQEAWPVANYWSDFRQTHPRVIVRDEGAA